MTMAPGEGERRALSGYVPQYKVAAEKIHARLSAGDLHEIGIADPEAATLDDIQIVHHQGSALVLDAFQVKWGDPTDVVVQAEFAGLLGEMAAGRKAIIDARDRRVKQGEAPVSRVICRVYTNRPPTTYSQKNDAMDGDGRSVHSFMEEVWRPAQREQKRALADVAPRWHAYCNKLASQHGMTADELLALAPDLRFEFNQVLPEDAITDDDRRSHERLKDLSEISSKLLDLVSSREDEYVWVTADALVAQHLGEEWRRRWHPLQRHEFPLRGSYEPLEKTTKKLQEALGHYDQGYVLLTGSPGSGKSTLLTHLLRTDARVAARYYAYVPESDDRLRGEASAFLHDLYLAIAGRRGRRAPVPRGGLDVLHAAFREELVALGERARELGQTQIILIDGLDHVKRSPEPHHPLLNELLPATEIPDGVLFVLGTRAVGDLPAHVSLAAGTDRHVEVEPLSRGAVLRLADKEGLADIGDKVAALSDGHPLLARTYLELVREVDAAQRARVLDELPPSLGDVWEFYRSVWETVSADPQLVSLLGMVSRIRGTIRLPWLLETGSDPADIERLRKLGYLFRRSGEDRWTFFHSSFREFLRERTAKLGDGHRPELAQAHHAGLAERCRVSGPASPERFERLFHLVEAGRSETALQEATPAYFREQLDSLRPRSEVRAEIQSTARALADCHDPQGIINLALAAHELRLRGYQYPEDTDFLLLLLAVDQPELAIEHLQEIDNGSSEHDRRKSAMKLALALHRRGLEAEALRLFELHEPLEWFGARPGSLRAAIRGHRPSLRAWAEIGALLAGPGHVIEMLKALRPPSGLHPQERYSDEDVIGMRAKLLFCAGQQLLWAGRWDEADVVRAELVELGDPAAAWLTLFDLRRVGYRHRRGVGDLGERNAIDAGALSGSTLVELAELHLRDGDDEAARAVFEQIDIPALPESRHFDRRDEPPWRSFFEYHRLATRLGFVSDPVKAVPDSPKEHHDQTVLTARHVVVFAVLEGRRERSAADIEAAIKAMHSFWSKSSAHEINRRPTAARQLMTERAIVMAGRLGADALKRLFAYFEDRWSKAPVMLYRDSTDVIRAFSHAGIGKISIRAALKALEEFHSRGESSPQDWVELGRAWAGAGDVGAARRCLSRAIGRTLAITSEDDVSLSTWTRLQGPLLRGPDGDELASALMEAFIALDRESVGGSPEDAASVLVGQLAECAPQTAQTVARRALDQHLLGPHDVLEDLLEARADRPSPHWWAAMNELLAVFGVDRPYWLLGRAVAADTTLAAPWLVHLVDRIATEGRPTLRRSWREEVKRIADLHHLAVAIGDEELTVGDETPPRTSTEAVTTDEAEPDDEASLVRLETREADDYIGIEPARALLDRYEHLDEGQRARLAACLAGTEEEAGVRVAEARLAIAASDDEAAWKAGVAAIETSRSGDWSRHWAGGPILELLPELRRIEADLLAPVMYRRIAEHGSSNDHFLNNLGVELDRCVGPLGLPAEAAAASALEVAAAVVGNLADLPDPASLRLATEERTAEPGAFEQAIDDLIGWLLRSDHMIAWQAAQRAILALLDSEPESAERILRTVLTEGETDACMRACAVIETAAIRDRALALADELAPLTASSSLALRVAAEMALHALSAAVPAPPAARPLPAGLALELQPADSREIASGLVAEVREHRRAIRALARTARVDRAALHQHVVRRSLAMGEQPVASGKHSIRGIFGYGYLRPSVKTVRRALDETAAQLVDARRADPAGALLAAELWPPYDSGLLVTRPGRRPAEVVAFLSAEGRRDNDLYKTPVKDLAAGAQKRIATRIDGWTVLGESTDLRLLNRYGHYEFRENGVVLTGWEDSGDAGLSSLRACPSNAYDRESGDAELEATTVIRTAGDQIASPSGWLALDPVIALALALRRDESRLFGWTLDGEPAVHSVWWRSGYCCWQPYSDADEVGEGWLVVASPAFMAALRAYGELARAGRVTTGRQGSSESPADETETDIGGYV